MENLFENWGETKVALLEGLTADMQKIVDPLLENQKNQIMQEDAAAGAISAHDVAGFRKILIPMIRRIMPGTIATELVGVQPMAAPVGLVYSLRYKYLEAAAETNRPGFDGNPLVANDSIALGDEAFGNDPVLRAFYSGAAGDGTTDPKAQVAGAGAIDAGTPGAIDATTTTGGGWPSSLDSTVHDTGTVFGDPIDGSLRGGSGSFIEGSGGRKMGLEIISQAVEARTRKLQAGWTIEAMQDMNSQHGLDVESEMTQALSAEITQEIDAEIINDLFALAGTVDTWDYATTGGAAFAPAYIGDRFANLSVVIKRVANEIGRKTRRGVANWIVVSPMVVSVLQSAAKSVFAPAVSGSFKGPNNTMLVGTLNGSIKVYSYLWNQNQPGTGATPVDSILIGYKGGNGETDTGYFYCPYIPIMSSGVVVSPVTFQPVVSLMTRYGKTSFTDSVTSLGNSADYYGKIAISNLVFS